MESTPHVQSFLSRLSQHRKALIAISSGLLVVVVVILLSGLSQSPNSPFPSPTPVPGNSSVGPQDAQKATLYPQGTVVYGSLQSSGTTLLAYDLNKKESKVVAQLPAHIKKVTVLTPDQVMYIAGVDEYGSGSSIVGYSLSKNTTTTILTADPGFRIDNYQLSPNQSYVAVWEIRLNPTTHSLLGGASRVYGMSTEASGQKFLIYDEVAISPIHYPVAVIGNGDIFFDTLLPGTSSGWAYGMSKANYTGSQKQTIPAMTNGTYTMPPVLSKDGNKLFFTGYDGSLGSGTQTIEGTRRALAVPNTIESLDTATLTREKLPAVANTNRYPSLKLGIDNNLVLTTLTPDVADIGFYTYDLGTATSALLPVPLQYANTIVGQVAKDRYLLAHNDRSSTTLGGLGPSYSTATTQAYLLDTISGKVAPLQGFSGMDQVISLQPAATYEDMPSVSQQQNKLQLGTFSLEPKLSENRIAVLNQPPPTAIPTPTPTIAPNTPTRVPIPPQDSPEGAV